MGHSGSRARMPEGPVPGTAMVQASVCIGRVLRNTNHSEPLNSQRMIRLPGPHQIWPGVSHPVSAKAPRELEKPAALFGTAQKPKAMKQPKGNAHLLRTPIENSLRAHALHLWPWQARATEGSEWGERAAGSSRCIRLHRLVVEAGLVAGSPRVMAPWGRRLAQLPVESGEKEAPTREPCEP